MMEFEKYNVEIIRSAWSYHLKNLKSLKNDPDQTVKSFEHKKLCEICNVKVRHCAWDAHI
jgi:hypothetical protein